MGLISMAEPGRVRVSKTLFTAEVSTKHYFHSGEIINIDMNYIPSSSPGILRSHVMTNSQLACRVNWLRSCTGIVKSAFESRQTWFLFFSLSFCNFFYYTTLTARIFSTFISNSRVFKTQNLRQHLEKYIGRKNSDYSIFQILSRCLIQCFLSNPVHIVNEI